MVPICNTCELIMQKKMSTKRTLINITNSFQILRLGHGNNEIYCNLWSGGLGREVLDLVLAIHKIQLFYKEIVFIDDTKPLGELINGYMSYPYSDFVEKFCVTDV
jgi:hypothetical protein